MNAIAEHGVIVDYDYCDDCDDDYNDGVNQVCHYETADEHDYDDVFGKVDKDADKDYGNYGKDDNKMIKLLVNLHTI